MKIACIIATYNGEAYLESQIESILHQQYGSEEKNQMDIYIRDDGSTDSTISIVEGFRKRNKQIHLMNDGRNHLGPKKSFYKLLTYVQNYDYVFFSDQDDIWVDDKVHILLSSFDNSAVVIPQLVFSDAWIADEYGKSTNQAMSQRYMWPNKQPNLQFLTMNYQITGATMVINQAATNLINKVDENIKENSYMHDSFIGLLIAACGHVHRINRPLIFYRQHADNVVGTVKQSGISLARFTSITATLSHLVNDNILLFEYLMKDSNMKKMSTRSLKVVEKYLTSFKEIQQSKPISVRRIKAIAEIKQNIWPKGLPTWIRLFLLFITRF
ncbi:MAG: glycosyltransferase family 2 protein [Lactobacillus sp.]|nr:glycosyltransferase family 2 protein [Lactobacillus sp.]